VYQLCNRAQLGQSFSLETTVDVDVPSAKFHLFARQTNDALDHQEIWLFWRTKGGNFPAPGLSPAVRQSIDENPLAWIGRGPEIMVVKLPAVRADHSLIAGRVCGIIADPESAIPTLQEVMFPWKCMGHRAPRDSNRSNQTLQSRQANPGHAPEHGQENQDRPDPLS
jgi:hypothetical protein